MSLFRSSTGGSPFSTPSSSSPTSSSRPILSSSSPLRHSHSPSTSHPSTPSGGGGPFAANSSIPRPFSATGFGNLPIGSNNLSQSPPRQGGHHGNHDQPSSSSNHRSSFSSSSSSISSSIFGHGGGQVAWNAGPWGSSGTSRPASRGSASTTNNTTTPTATTPLNTGMPSPALTPVQQSQSGNGGQNRSPVSIGGGRLATTGFAWSEIQEVPREWSFFGVDIPITNVRAIRDEVEAPIPSSSLHDSSSSDLGTIPNNAPFGSFNAQNMGVGGGGAGVRSSSAAGSAEIASYTFGGGRWNLELVRSPNSLPNEETVPLLGTTEPDDPTATSTTTTAPTTPQGHEQPRSPAKISLYLTCHLLESDWPASDVNYPATIMVGVREPREQVGLRGGRKGWVWSCWERDWCFGSDNEFWECRTFPTLSSLLSNPRIDLHDSFILSIQIQNQSAPCMGLSPTHTPQVPEFHSVPRDILDGVEGLLDDRVTGDVRIVVHEKKVGSAVVSSDDGGGGCLEGEREAEGTDLGSPSNRLGQHSQHRDQEPSVRDAEQPQQPVYRKRCFYAHSSILRARATYFDSMLTAYWAESQGANVGTAAEVEGLTPTRDSFRATTRSGARKVHEVKIDDFDYKTVYWLLRWIYTNEIEFDETHDVRSLLDEDLPEGSCDKLGWDWRKLGDVGDDEVFPPSPGQASTPHVGGLSDIQEDRGEDDDRVAAASGGGQADRRIVTGARSTGAGKNTRRSVSDTGTLIPSAVAPSPAAATGSSSQLKRRSVTPESSSSAGTVDTSNTNSTVIPPSPAGPSSSARSFIQGRVSPVQPGRTSPIQLLGSFGPTPAPAHVSHSHGHGHGHGHGHAHGHGRIHGLGQERRSVPGSVTGSTPTAIATGAAVAQQGPVGGVSGTGQGQIQGDGRKAERDERRVEVDDPHPHPALSPGPASALAVYRLAHRYCIHPLEQLALSHIVSALTPATAFPLLLATHLFPDVHDAIKFYAYRNFSLIIREPEFKRCYEEVGQGLWERGGDVLYEFTVGGLVPNYGI